MMRTQLSKESPEATITTELDATVKVEYCCDYDDNPLTRTVKSELAEFHNSHNDNRDSLSLNDMKTVSLETIPKEEAKSICSEDDNDPTTTSSGGEDELNPNNTDNDDGSDSDPERDPFADVDCDQHFYQRPAPSHNSKYSTTQNKLKNAADDGDSSNHSSSTNNILPIPTTCKQKLQLKTEQLNLANLQCKLCFEKHISEDELNNHLRICAASPKVRRRFCVPCNKIFSRADKYRNHALTRHGVKDAVSRLSFSCDVCQRFFLHKESLAAHSVLHIEKTSIAENEDASRLRPFKCPECTWSFRDLSGLTKHRQSHKNERRFRCPIPGCGKTFNFSSNINYHIKTSHSDLKPFECQEPNCDKAFKTNALLNKHRVCHLVDRSFQCPHSDCDQTFKSKESVTSHLAVHAGGPKPITERPFKCGQCDLAFCKKWDLTRHLQTHNIKEKDFVKCAEPNCHKRFKFKRNLKIHVLNVHTNNADSPIFECPEPNCDKKFKTESVFKAHMKTHTRPHKCKEPGCFADFPKPSLLSSHMKSKHNISGVKK